MEINGYELIKFFYNELDTNTEMQKDHQPKHIAIYTRIIEVQNQIGWKVHTIGIPTEVTKHYAGIGCPNNYRECLKELEHWGLIREVTPSVNQHQSRKITLQTEKLKAYLKAKAEERNKDKEDNAYGNKADATPKQHLSNHKAPTEATANQTQSEAEAPTLYKTNKLSKPTKLEKQANEPNRETTETKNPSLDDILSYASSKGANEVTWLTKWFYTMEDKEWISNDKPIRNWRKYLQSVLDAEFLKGNKAQETKTEQALPKDKFNQEDIDTATKKALMFFEKNSLEATYNHIDYTDWLSNEEKKVVKQAVNNVADKQQLPF